MGRVSVGPMGLDVEIIQPEFRDESPESVEISGTITKGSKTPIFIVWAVVTALLLVGLKSLVWGSGTGQERAAGTTTVPFGDRDPDQFADFPGLSPEGLPDQSGSQPQRRRTTLAEWPGGDSLIVVENSQFIYEIDLATGRRTSFAPPELLVDADPVVIRDQVVVIGESGAWRGTPFLYEWTYLGAADRLVRSTHPDRVWLRTGSNEPAPDGQYLWSEIDENGVLQRTVLHERVTDFPTPELRAGPGPGISRLGESTTSRWESISEFGIPIAVGPNDLVAWECSGLICERVWYDPETGLPKGGFYPDLADNVDVRPGSLLSPDGRFVISRSGDAQQSMTIASVANGREIETSCIWDEPITWTFNSALLACATPRGVEVLRSDTGVSMGDATVPNAKWNRIVFMSTAYLSRLR